MGRKTELQRGGIANPLAQHLRLQRASGEIRSRLIRARPREHEPGLARFPGRPADDATIDELNAGRAQFLVDPPRPRRGDRVRVQIEPAIATGSDALGQLLGAMRRANADQQVAFRGDIRQVTGIAQALGLRPHGRLRAAPRARPMDRMPTIPKRGGDGFAHHPRV